MAAFGPGWNIWPWLACDGPALVTWGSGCKGGVGPALLLVFEAGASRIGSKAATLAGAAVGGNWRVSGCTAAAAGLLLLLCGPARVAAEAASLDAMAEGMSGCEGWAGGGPIPALLLLLLLPLTGFSTGLVLFKKFNPACQARPVLLLLVVPKGGRGSAWTVGLLKFGGCCRLSWACAVISDSALPLLPLVLATWLGWGRAWLATVVVVVGCCCRSTTGVG